METKLHGETKLNFTDKWNATNAVTIDGQDSVTIDTIDSSTGKAIFSSEVPVSEFLTSDRYSNLGTPAQRLEMLRQSTQKGQKNESFQSKDYAPSLPISKKLSEYVERLTLSRISKS